MSEKARMKHQELENIEYYDSELKLSVFILDLLSVFLTHQEVLGEKGQSI
jgi:hypothetical protein